MYLVVTGSAFDHSLFGHEEIENWIENGEHAVRHNNS